MTEITDEIHTSEEAVCGCQFDLRDHIPVCCNPCDLHSSWYQDFVDKVYVDCTIQGSNKN